VNTLEVAGLHKAFGRRAVLHDLALAVPAGSFTAILGESGSGKTTLLRIVAGFERADRGIVRVGGNVAEDGGATWLAPEQRNIGYVPQEGSLFPHLTVRRNVGFGLSRAEVRAGRVDELLELVGIGGLGGRYPHQLSGGQQQRVALARALAVRPSLLLLDEPFSSLDASMRASVRAEVRELVRAAGTTTLLVTHDQEEALSLADQVAVIRDGRIGQTGSPREIYNRPVDPELAGFLGEANLLPGVSSGSRVQTAFGELELLDGPTASAASTVLVRPEQLEVCDPDHPDGVAGEVVALEYHGRDAVMQVRLAAERDRVVVVRVAGRAAQPVGRQVGLLVRGVVVAWSQPSSGPATPLEPGVPAAGRAAPAGD
jgi:iron(III) transport system ATP-binding protein